MVVKNSSVGGWWGILAVVLTVCGFIRASAEEDSQLEAFRQGKAVELPPFMVLERGGTSNPWQYLSAPGLEVLSKCPNWETLRFVDMYVRRDRELAKIFPDFLRVRQSVPATMILITHRMYEEMRGQMADVMKDKMASDWSIIPQVVLWDGESVGMTYEPGGVDYYTISFTRDHVAELLNRRTPPLPLWFRTGIDSIYEEIRWQDEEITLPRLSWPGRKTPGQQSQRNLPEAVLPMGEFLAGPFDSQKQMLLGPRLQLWLVQDELFLRWALDDKSHARREALWKFADASSREPVTEALFRRCFGMGFAEMENELTKFIPRAEKEPIEVLDPDAVNTPALSSVRDATAVEVARIKGDFELKEVEYVRKTSPAYVDQYLGQAAADLLGPYQQGVRDPEYLAVLGLYYCEIRKSDLARPLLEQAAAAHVPRPSVYVELARIRLAEALAQPTGQDGKLGSDQVAAILGPLKESRLYAPAQADAFLLAVAVWNHTAVPPSADDLAFLEEGLVFFPTDGLAAAVAKIRAWSRPAGEAQILSH